MVKLGLINSRLKDFHDIWFLASIHTFDGAILQTALRRTFARRETRVVWPISALSPAFLDGSSRQAQWDGFLRKSNLVDAPQRLELVQAELSRFLGPVIEALEADRPFTAVWTPPGPWADQRR